MVSHNPAVPGIDVAVVKEGVESTELLARGRQVDTGKETDFASVVDAEPPEMGMLTIIIPLPICP